MRKIFFLFVLCFVLAACDFGNQEIVYEKIMPSETEMPTDEVDDVLPTIEDDDELSGKKKYSWVVMLYMAADNNLESNAIADLNELERVDFSDEVKVLVLLDRASGFDATNSNWTDTRLYEVEFDDLNSNAIVSRQIPCSSLGLSLNVQTELDMSDVSTLSGFVSFCVENYDSEHYAFLMWGHGSSDGFAKDNYSGGEMPVSLVRTGLENALGKQKLDVIGFDTCFSMNLENMYELKDCALYACGTAGLVSERGWNYESIFDGFMWSDLSVESLLDHISTGYEKEYSAYEYACFSVVDLSHVEELVFAFDAACEKTAHLIVDYVSRDKVLQAFEKDSVQYCGNSYPCNCYVDVFSLSTNLKTIGKDVSVYWDKVLDCLKKAVIDGMALDEKGKSLGVFYSMQIGKSISATNHPNNYVQGVNDFSQCRFVRMACNYVPSVLNQGSLLDKLFYTIF